MNPRLNISISTLIAVNMIPLAGVLVFGWNISSIMFLYWLESAVVGFYNIIRMLKAEGKIEPGTRFTVNGVPRNPTKALIIPFFMLHYGIFMFVHLVFIFTFFKFPTFEFTLLFAFVSLVVSHGISHNVNFLGNEEYKNVSITAQMMKPYARIFVMHITILVGGMITLSMGTPIGALFLMIGLKIIIDISSHLREHGFLKKFRVNTKIQS